jgi:hypothetical protein
MSVLLLPLPLELDPKLVERALVVIKAVNHSCWKGHCWPIWPVLGLRTALLVELVHYSICSR